MDIENRIWNIIEKIKNTEFSDRNNEIWLTGPEYNMDSVDMVYLVLEIQKEFNYNFVKDDFENYKFVNVSGIKDALLNY